MKTSTCDEIRCISEINCIDQWHDVYSNNDACKKAKGGYKKTIGHMVYYKMGKVN